MDDDLKEFYEYFNNIYNYIDNELQQNGQLTIDVLLLDKNPSDVLDIISNYAPNSFSYLMEKEDLKNFFIGYLFKKKKYYENLSISADKLEKLIDKSGPGEEQHRKEDSLYYHERNQEEYLNNILNRLIDCVNMYYNLYYNKDIKLLLGDGTNLYLQFLEENLLHVLGITNRQVNNNQELRRALNVPEWRTMNSMEILERIIKDIQTNKDIICLQMQKNIEKIKRFGTSGQIIKTQLDSSTENELLPYDKIDLKTRAFLNSGPYNGASVVSGLAPGTYFIGGDKGKLDNDREIQQVRISKTDFETLKKQPLTITTASGEQIRITTGDYIFSGYTLKPEDKRSIKSVKIGSSKVSGLDSKNPRADGLAKFREMFNYQSPIPVIGVESPDGGTTKIFTPEEQQKLFLSLYYDFGGVGGMNFELYFEMLKDFAEKFKNELESKAIKRDELSIEISNSNEKKL